MQAFDVSITDLEGKTLTTLFQYSGLEVAIPLNGPRTARLNLSLYNPKCVFVRGYDRLLKVRFYGIPVFWGIIKNPTWTGSGGTVEVNCVDATIKLLMNFIREGDIVHDEGYDIAGGIGMWEIIEGARLSGGWEDHDPTIPDLGIAEGFSDYESPIGVATKKVERGQQIQTEIDDFAESSVGPDWELQPIDERYNPNGSSLATAKGSRNFVEMNVYERQGDPDKWETVRFHHGWGVDNAEDATLEEGDIVNYAVAVGGKGNEKRAIARNVTSWEQYGIYGEWESGGSTGEEGIEVNVRAVLRNRASLPLMTNSYPPKTFTIIPRVEAPDDKFTLRYMRDFKVGDTAYIASKKGFQNFKGTGRITEVILTRDDASGLPRQVVTCVPRNLVDEGQIQVFDE
jgi:hypothetical protein